MTSNQKFFRPENRRYWLLALGVGAGLISLIAFVFFQNPWEGAVKFLCGFYTVCTGVFFLAQIYGFVISQTHYSEAVEAPKFTMLENEEAQWRS